MSDSNYPIQSSRLTAVEIWNKGIPYVSPNITNQIQVNTEYNTVGIDTSPSTVEKLTVNGNINLLNGNYNVNGQKVILDSSNIVLNTSNNFISQIESLLLRIETLENN